jgi:L-ascorbate metabolism protein UlaG (beta-lactamase superfamily)
VTSTTSPSHLKLTYVGHATNLIEMQGARILTDPLLRNRIVHLRRSSVSFDPTLYQSIDAVLISHLHHDHCDLPSLRLLGQDVRIIVPVGAGSLIKKWGFANVEEIAIGDAIQINDLSIIATKAKHAGLRPPFGPTSQTIGYMINGSHQVYFAGDTDIFPEMAALPRNIDVTLLPVWGWGPTLGAGHLNPHEAARALQLIKPKIAVPIHWGTFSPFGLHWLNLSFMSIPPRLFAHYAGEIAPNVQIEILEPGESLVLPD